MALATGAARGVRWRPSRDSTSCSRRPGWASPSAAVIHAWIEADALRAALARARLGRPSNPHNRAAARRSWETRGLGCTPPAPRPERRIVRSRVPLAGRPRGCRLTSSRPPVPHPLRCGQRTCPGSRGRGRSSQRAPPARFAPRCSRPARASRPPRGTFLDQAARASGASPSRPNCRSHAGAAAGGSAAIEGALPSNPTSRRRAAALRGQRRRAASRLAASAAGRPGGSSRSDGRGCRWPGPAPRLVIREAGHLLVQERAVLAQQETPDLSPLLGQRDQDDAAVERVRFASHPSPRHHPVDQQGDRRLRDPLAGRQLRDPAWTLGQALNTPASVRDTRTLDCARNNRDNVAARTGNASAISSI